MVEHRAEIIEVRQVSDSAIAILARCCGDEMTDSWHTLYDLENLEQHLAEHPQRVAERHARIDAHLQKVAQLGHAITKGHVTQGHCQHCGRGIQGTSTESI